MFLPQLASNHDPSHLCLLCGRDCKCEAPHLTPAHILRRDGNGFLEKESLSDLNDSGSPKLTYT
jgi:hypothetical protein